MNWPLVISGLGVGVIFGYTLQHGRFCMNTAFREVLLSRDFTVFRIYILALLILILGANGLDAAGIIKLRVIPFTWLANVLGGYIFGVGMVLAGGCATGTLYRVGEGMIGSWFAALGFLLTAASTLSGVLNPIARFLWFGPGFDPSNLSSAKFLYSVVDADGNLLPVTMYSVLGVSRWIVIAVLAVPALIFIAKGNFKRPTSQKGFSWWLTGTIVGLVAIAAFYTSQVWGGFPHARGLSFTGPLNELSAWFTGAAKFAAIKKTAVVAQADDVSGVVGKLGTLTWSVWMIFGLVLGSFISAYSNKEFSWRAPKAQSLVTQFSGGLIMGFGATLAGGCNIGHGLTGLSTLALGSLVSIIFIVLGSWTMVYFLFIRE
ncbi:MAG: YeeE/YedE family protein [Nitrospirota bacterium]